MEQTGKEKSSSHPISPCAVAITGQLQRELGPAAEHQHLVGGLHVLLQEGKHVLVREGADLLAGAAEGQRQRQRDAAKDGKITSRERTYCYRDGLVGLGLCNLFFLGRNAGCYMQG